LVIVLVKGEIMEEAKIVNLYDLNETIAKDLISKYEYPWEVLPHISDYILEIGPTLPEDEYKEIAENVWVHKTATIDKSATIKGPTIIGSDTEVRPGAYIRGKVIIGNECVIGNSCEFKNCILFNVVKVPHYSYVGDSIIGFHSHMGAGAIASNLKADNQAVTIKKYDNDGNVVESLETGMRKIGAMLGDSVEIGCQCVLNPGTVVGRYSNVYPLSMVRGVVPEKHIYKAKDNIVPKN
jgi:NDP-sugar pyrophosphorylase family protein